MNLPLSHLWLPADTPSKHLVIVLHGLGDSADGFLWLQDALGMDSINYLLLTAPDPYYIGFRWYDIASNPLAGVVRSRQLLSQVLAATEQNYPPDQTFLLGFSQGCLMTLEFGARHSKCLAGYVGISGYSLDPAALLRDLNPEVNQGDWLITHGTRDDVLPVQVTRAQIKMLREGGFKMDYREYPKVHTIDAERELPEIRDWIAARLSRK